MNEAQKQVVITLRSKGLGYKKISEQTGINLSSIKMFCIRNNISSSPKAVTAEVPEGFCKNCGKPITQKPKTKKKLFCCHECALSWWHCHRDLTNSKKTCIVTCFGCGCEFISNINADRKYCSVQCFADHRYGRLNNAAE